MRITLLLIGKTSLDHVQEGMDMYLQRMKPIADFEVKVVQVKIKGNLSPEQTKQIEGDAILKNCPEGDLILFDEKGKSMDSVKFARYIEQFSIRGARQVTFVIGGAYGFSPEVYQRAQGKVALSAMTFSHQLVRLIALEQFYRAHAIIKGLPYHHA